MKTQFYTAASLDGFIADPNDSLDWLLQFEMTDDYPDFISEVGALAMGSATYEWLLNNLSRSNEDIQTSWPYKQPTWVFSSRTLPDIPGVELYFVNGDVGLIHKEMVVAADGKNIWLVGGGELVGQFHDQGLLDELIVTVAPVTLSRGKPLLPRVIADPPLKLLSARPIGEVFVQIRYEVQRK